MYDIVCIFYHNIHKYIYIMYGYIIHTVPYLSAPKSLPPNATNDNHPSVSEGSSPRPVYPAPSSFPSVAAWLGAQPCAALPVRSSAPNETIRASGARNEATKSSMELCSMWRSRIVQKILLEHQIQLARHATSSCPVTVICFTAQRSLSQPEEVLLSQGSLKEICSSSSIWAIKRNLRLRHPVKIRS